MNLCCYNRKSTSKVFCLAVSRPIFMRCNAHSSKYEPVVGEIKLVECNPRYTYVQLPDRCEETTSTQNLDPKKSLGPNHVCLHCRYKRSTTQPHTLNNSVVRNRLMRKFSLSPNKNQLEINKEYALISFGIVRCSCELLVKRHNSDRLTLGGRM